MEKSSLAAAVVPMRSLSRLCSSVPPPLWCSDAPSAHIFRSPPSLVLFEMRYCQVLDMPLPLPALFVSEELKTHLRTAVTKVPRRAPAPSGRKDFVLDKVLVWRNVQPLVRQGQLI